MLSNNEKGSIGLVCAIAELTKQKYEVSLPISEHAVYDCIAEKNGILKRVQVRYTSVSKKKMVEVKLKSSYHSHTKGNYFKKRKVGDYDILAIYCPNTNQVYFISDREFKNGSSITLRLEPEAEKKTNHKWFLQNYLECDRAFGI